MGTLKTRDWKTWDQITAMEKAGLYNGPVFSSPAFSVDKIHSLLGFNHPVCEK